MKTTTISRFAALLILVLAAHRAADAQTVTVAFSGDTAPGTSDTYSFFNSPVLNDTGQTAFLGVLNSSSTTDHGIWSEGGGSGLALVARLGNAAPGTSNTFASLLSPVLNDTGQTAFYGVLNGSLTANLGIWSEGGGSGLTLVARSENVAPGTSDTFFFSVTDTPVLNDAGQTAFRGSFITGMTDRGIWSEGGGSGLTLVARTGDAAPGTSDTFFVFNSPVLNDAGQMAFLGRITDSGVGFEHGIWSEGGGSGLALVARTESVAPGTSDTFTNFSIPTLNNVGQTTFFGVLISSDNTTGVGIWSEGGGSGLALVARSENVAPRHQ